MLMQIILTPCPAHQCTINKRQLELQAQMLHAKSPSSVHAETLSFRNIFPDLVLREPIRPSPVRATRPVTELLDPLVRFERLFQRERCYRSKDGVHLHAFLVSEQRLEFLRLCPVGDWEHFSLRIFVLTISRNFRKVDVLAIGIIRRLLRRFAGASTWCAMGLRWAGSVGRLCKRNLATGILGHVHRVSWSLGLAGLENRGSRLSILPISIHGWLLSRFLHQSECIPSFAVHSHVPFECSIGESAAPLLAASPHGFLRRLSSSA